MGTVATAKVINSSWGAVNFRPALESDAAAIREIYAPYVEEISFEEKVPSVYEMAARIRARQGKFPFIVAERAGTIVGFAYASAFHERSAYRYCAEVTIYLDRNSRRGGIGQALYHRLEQLLQIQGFTNLYACIAYSEALAQKQLGAMCSMVCSIIAVTNLAAGMTCVGWKRSFMAKEKRARSCCLVMRLMRA